MNPGKALQYIVIVIIIIGTAIVLYRGGYSLALNTQYTSGYADGYKAGYQAGNAAGYIAGYHDGTNQFYLENWSQYSEVQGGKTRWIPINYQHCPVCLATIMDI